MASESILSEATRLTEGVRQADYGHPLDNFGLEAELVTAAFRKKLAPGEVFTAEDISIFQILVKVARQRHRHKRDNLVDIAGYASCAQRVVEERERREGIARATGESGVAAGLGAPGEPAGVPGEPCGAPVRSDGAGFEEQLGSGGYPAAGLGRPVAAPAPKAGCGCRACETRREQGPEGIGAAV